MFAHKLCFSQIRLLQICYAAVCLGMRFFRRESHRLKAIIYIWLSALISDRPYRIVMHGIHHDYLKSYYQTLSFHGKCVPIKPQYVIWVNCTNCLLYSSIKSGKTNMSGITWFIERVVPATQGLFLYREAICSHSQTVRS